MNKSEKVLFSGVVIGLLIVASFIYVISRPPIIKPEKGISLKEAFSKSGVQDKTFGALIREGSGEYNEANISRSGRSDEWDFTYYFNAPFSPPECQNFRVNAKGVIFDETTESGCDSLPTITTWKIDSPEAARTILQSSRAKSDFGDTNKVQISSMGIRKISNLDDPYWIIWLVESSHDSQKFYLNANTGEII